MIGVDHPQLEFGLELIEVGKQNGCKRVDLNYAFSTLWQTHINGTPPKMSK